VAADAEAGGVARAAAGRRVAPAPLDLHRANYRDGGGVGAADEHLRSDRITTVRNHSFESLQQDIWPAFVGFCLLGVVGGLLGGAGRLPDFVFGLALVAVPTLFIVWAVARLDPRDIVRIINKGGEGDA
jgi:hypothetical protein